MARNTSAITSSGWFCDRMPVIACQQLHTSHPTTLTKVPARLLDGLLGQGGWRGIECVLHMDGSVHTGYGGHLDGGVAGLRRLIRLDDIVAATDALHECVLLGSPFGVQQRLGWEGVRGVNVMQGVCNTCIRTYRYTRTSSALVLVHELVQNDDLVVGRIGAQRIQHLVAIHHKFLRHT